MVYGLIGVVVLLFYFSFLFLVFVITVLLRVKGKKRFKQRCDAYWCRVFPAARAGDGFGVFGVLFVWLFFGANSLPLSYYIRRAMHSPQKKKVRIVQSYDKSFNPVIFQQLLAGKTLHRLRVIALLQLFNSSRKAG